MFMRRENKPLVFGFDSMCRVFGKKHNLYAIIEKRKFHKFLLKFIVD